jgi:hypothetical protein
MEFNFKPCYTASNIFTRAITYENNCHMLLMTQLTLYEPLRVTHDLQCD